MEDSERKIRSWQRLIPLAFPKFCLLLDDVPTTRKVFRRFHVASRHYLALPHRPLFRAEKKGDPVAKRAGAWPKRLLWHPWHNPASGNALPENIGGRQAPSVYRTPFVFRANRARCWSYGRPLGNCNGQLLLPVFLFGTGGSNAARRREAGPCRFSCGDRENSEARAGSEARGTVATNTVPQIPLACDTLSAERHPAPV